MTIVIDLHITDVTTNQRNMHFYYFYYVYTSPTVKVFPKTLIL